MPLQLSDLQTSYEKRIQVTREAGQELLQAVKFLRDDSDDRCERWLDRCDKYAERMKDE